MRTALLTSLAGLILTAGSASADEPVDYLRDVKPLLAQRCVTCHGASKPRAGLRLDTAESALKGGTSGPSVLPGQSEESPLILAILGDGFERMPLKRAPLAESEVATLRRWIDAGAVYPSDEVASPAPTHWAFLPPVRTPVPAVCDASWPRNPIDHFILAPLERDGIAPSAEADRATLLRRASLDVIGLPPTPAEVEAFVNDNRPDAYERQVDRLLASPHYGERWGRLWLDGARYADSNGYSIDAPRTIWKYRDWVINALNADMPFDDFTIDQLAGDLRPDATLDQKVATGFHRNTPINQEGGIDLEQFRIDSIHDRVSTTATVFLGLTMGCCQCHDHKYDPITQKEYYRFFAFFNNVDEPDLPIAPPEDVAKAKAAREKAAAYLKEIAAKDPTLWDKQRAWESGLDMLGRQRQSQEVRTAFDVTFDKRSDELKHVVFAAYIDQAPEAKEHREVIAKIRADEPKFVTSMVVEERKDPRATHLLIQGDFTRPGERVQPGTPAVLQSLDTPPEQANRMALARWIADPANPLTARVAVNRLWQVYFGRGLVETENDFGTQGTPPTHPELLDWLAVELTARGWSLKAIHRLILTSATYRQASKVRPDLKSIDPDNRRLARQSRLRVDAELVRDSALVASGLFTPTIGGPGVYPPQPEGVTNLGQRRRDWTAETGPDRYRRGMYTFFWRATPHPMLTVFDAPDAIRACTRRPRSNTPLQALTMLNDEASYEFATALADRVLREGPSDDPGRLDYAFRLCLARSPGATEASRLIALREARRDAGGDERASWIDVARVLLNLDEFITRE